MSSTVRSRGAWTKARAGVCFFLIALVAVLLPSATSAQQIRGTLSNFDAHNENDEEMTNLELDIRNIRPDQVIGYYQGPSQWGVPPVIRDIGGTEITWADFRTPILPGGMRHFGLEVDSNAPFPCGVQAYWTKHVKVIEIPVPWQTWRPAPGAVIDVIRLGPDFPEPVVVNRERAVLPFRLELNELVWDNPMIPWEPVPGEPVVIAPDQTVELPIEVDPDARGVFVRYTVALERNPDNVLTRFVNEAEIDFVIDPFTPSIVGSLSNFDVHNDTGKPVHDFELDLLNITPQDIQGWYNGPDAWGLHPVTGDPAIGVIPGGTEVNWVDEWNALPYCETRHFGLRLNPSAPEPLVRAFWTRVVKVRQIPVPWQWWQPGPGSVVTDVIQLSDTFDSPVFVEREWAVSPQPIPLDELVWDNPAVAWQPDPAGPVLLEPGDQTFLDINVTGPALAQAVLVRYTVTPQLQPQPVAETRFVNEALLGGATDPPEIIGSLSNFDVINLGDDAYTNLEFDIRAVQPHHILDWYRGQQAWGLHPVTQAPMIRALPQTEVMWADFNDPLPYCQTRHFGLELVSDAPPPCGVQAYWTQHRKVVEIPVPWQTWSPVPDAVIDVIRLDPDASEPVMVRREFARAPFRLPLDELNWDNPAIPWEPVPTDPVIIPPGGVVELPIQIFLEDQAVFVRYEVAQLGNPDDVITRFVNSAWIETGPGRQIPAIVGELSNFDVHNATGKPVHDLELDLRNVRPEDVLDWYRGPDAWGIDPVIRWTPDGTATEVTWVDDRDPIRHCETRHFGLMLAPGNQEPLVRAFWTRHVKVAQIPVPWQFWIVPDGPFIRDVIQLSDTFTEPVTVRREFAVVDEIVGLDDLNWDLIAPWQPDPAGDIVLRPGFQADLDIEVDPHDDAAVLVRYEVELPSTGSIVTRFVNEAMLGPGTVSGLHFESKADMAWNPSVLRTALYDVVRGDLFAMRGFGDVRDASCIGNDVPSPAFPAVAPVPAGGGYYYLVRGDTPDGQKGTYDTTTDPLLREGRDGEVVSSLDCP